MIANPAADPAPLAFPLSLRFKTIAIAQQISVTDAAGQLVLYAKQRAFRLREAVAIHADREQTRPLYSIGADRIVDLSAEYRIQDTMGNVLGALKRHGMRSFWKAHYEIRRDGGTVLVIREENAWVKVMDGLLGSIPILNLLSGYLFNPSYEIRRADTDEVVMRLTKRPALLEGRFTLEEISELQPTDTNLAVVGTVMMILLERRRG